MDTYAACNACSTVNRVKVEKLSDTPKCAKCHAALPYDGAVLHLSEAALSALLNHCPQPVAVDFWAEWCGPCRTYGPIFAEVAKQELGSVVMVKVDTEKEPALSGAMGIRGIPATVLFRAGEEAKRQAGVMPAPMLKQWLST
jgi:thioredoxin 2